MAKQTSLEISIAVDSGRVKSNLDRVQAAFQAATSGINASLASIKGFADLKKQTEATTKAYGEAQRKVADLAREIKTGAGGAALARDFALAKVEAGRLKQPPPARGRGLKHRGAGGLCHRRGAAPRAGAWIETSCRTSRTPAPAAAPRAGAWIETL